MENISEKDLHPYHLEGFEFFQTEDHVENYDQKTVKEKMPEIINAFKTSKFLIITGDTGCGKSTQIPKLLLNHFENIICTQPRRVAAINVAKRISQDLKCKLGTKVGYTIRFKSLTSEITNLKIVTDGILLNEINKAKHLIADSSLSINEKRKIAASDLIIIDEAHERTLNIEFLLSYLKNILNDDECITTKLLIMSATLHTEKFIEYFNCPVINIKHKRYKIDLFYLKEKRIFHDCVNLSVNTVEKILKQYSSGDILVFLPGQREIEHAYAILSLSTIGLNVVVLQLFSSLPFHKQKLVFRKGPRKIILSTNIAETSITIENIKFIVDCGKVKRNKYIKGINFLETTTISKAEANQRAGRVGRTQSGVVFRIYTREQYCKMDENLEPNILRSSLNNVILSLKNLRIKNIYEFDFMDKLSVSCISSTISFLKSSGLIDFNENLTILGKFILNIPLAPEWSVCLYAANRKRCLNSVATIIPFLLNYRSIFINVERNDPNYEQYVWVQKSFSHSKGEFYKFLNIYSAWFNSGFSKLFLRQNFLNIKTMYEIKRVRKQLLHFFPRQQDTCMDIESAFCCGLFQNVAKKVEDENSCSYTSLLEFSNCYIDKNDSLCGKNPNYILFQDLYLSERNKNVLRNCLEIDHELYETANDNYFIHNELFS